ncbi:MAG: hypothetical protein CMM93_01705 [Rickettsiales bacterium]|nr:hypothetical protein [Rickettsiales bacterium]|tara:strand:+ start:5008 stop:5970 length:963 start_codon:yes stop_codon:yes gene_type:complete
MFGFKKREQPPTPGWLRIGMVLLVLFAATRAWKESAEDTGSPIDISNYPALTEVTNTEPWEKVYNPDYNKTVTRHVIKEGVGDPAVCGQKMEIEATLLEASSAAPDPEWPDNPIAYTVGSGPILWDSMTYGLKQGSVYEVDIGVRLFDPEIDDLEVPPHRAQISILSVTPFNDSPYPFAMTLLREGLGNPARCGETIPVTWRLLNTKGEELLARTENDQAQEIAVGQNALGHGIDRGLLGIKEYEVRKLEIPPAYHPQSGDLPFPKDELAIVEIQRMPYGAEKSEEEHAPEPDRESTTGSETIPDDGSDGESAGDESRGP